MAKVTEQDLVKLGFKRKYSLDKSSYWFEKTFKHKLLGKVFIIADIYDSSLDIGYRTKINNYITKKERPLTLSNLDLFIRFAEGKEL